MIPPYVKLKNNDAQYYVGGEILQRILLYFLFIVPIYAHKFPGFVSLAIVDTFTGKNENILLEPNKIINDNYHHFEIKVRSIEADVEDAGVAWIDLEIYYQPSKAEVPVCVQFGKLCTNQVYRFENTRYIIGFDILPYVDEEAYLSSETS